MILYQSLRRIYMCRIRSPVEDDRENDPTVDLLTQAPWERFQWWVSAIIINIIIIIIIIIIISFMQGIYTYIPETNYVPREYSSAAILLLLFMVLISLVSVLNLLCFYISTFCSMCAVPNMAVFYSSLNSCFPGMLLTYLLNDFEIVTVAPMITGITFYYYYYYYYYGCVGSIIPWNMPTTDTQGAEFCQSQARSISSSCLKLGSLGV